MPHPSSTSSSERRSLSLAGSLTGLRPWGVLWMVAFLLAGELFVARSEWFWTWPERSRSGAFRVLERRVMARRPNPVVAIVGSSRLRDALAPAALEDELGLPRGAVANLSLTSGSPLDERALLQRNGVWFSRASVLVVGVEDWYFVNAYAPHERERRFATWPEQEAGWAGRGDLPRALLEHCVWSFGAARRLGDLVRAGPRPLVRPLRLDGDDRLTWRRAKVAEGPPSVPVGAAVRRYYGAVGDHAAGEVRGPSFREAALRDVVRAGRAAGLRVVFVQVPWREEYVDGVEGGHAAAWRTYHDRLAALAGRLDVPLIAADRGSESGLRRTDFVDYGHMTEAAGARYAAWLAARLRAIGVVAGRDGR